MDYIHLLYIYIYMYIYIYIYILLHIYISPLYPSISQLLGSSPAVSTAAPRQPRPQRLANAHAHAAAAALWRRRGGGGLRQVVVFTHLDDHALSISWGFHGIIMAITLWLCQR